MIALLYWWLCLLIVCCQSNRIPHNEEYTNYAPDNLWKIENIRQKSGSDLILKCNNHHLNRTNITWEFKACISDFQGVQCDDRYIETVDATDQDWKKLDFNRGKKRLEIRNVSEENVGIYRCIYSETESESVIQAYIVDVIGLTKYWKSPPEVISLISSPNSTILAATPLVIQCKIHSLSAPVIRWFKGCNGRKCEIYDNGFCFCPIQYSDLLFPIGDNVYLSKLSIFNTRNIDSGTYACLVISFHGKDYKKINVKIQDPNAETTVTAGKSFSLLFLIPLGFVLVPVTVWLCYYRGKMRKRAIHEQQKQLINKPVVQVDIVLEESHAII